MLVLIVSCGWFSESLPCLSPAPNLQRIQVHDYTNVVLHPCRLEMAEGTSGASLITYTGNIGLGKGGTDQYPLDDSWREGQFTSSPEGHALAFDRLYFQLWYPATATFDLGRPCTAVYIALVQDHGPYPEEALEYRVEVSSDGIEFAPLPTDTPIILFRRGWSAAGEALFTGEVLQESEPSGQTTEGLASWADVLNDDWTARWDLVQPARYFNEPEIDAVICVD